LPFRRRGDTIPWWLEHQRSRSRAANTGSTKTVCSPLAILARARTRAGSRRRRPPRLMLASPNCEITGEVIPLSGISRLSWSCEVT